MGMKDGISLHYMGLQYALLYADSIGLQFPQRHCQQHAKESYVLKLQSWVDSQQSMIRPQVKNSGHASAIRPSQCL